MAYDEDLAWRVRAVLPPAEAVTERQMFGGLAFMLSGHMFCGVVRDTLMVRLGPDAVGPALNQPHVRPMDFTGRPVKGMVFVEFDIESWNTDEVIGRARGERFDIDRHEFRTAVKAATYHQFESHPTPQGWEIRVFVDV